MLTTREPCYFPFSFRCAIQSYAHLFKCAHRNLAYLRMTGLCVCVCVVWWCASRASNRSHYCYLSQQYGSTAFMHSFRWHTKLTNTHAIAYGCVAKDDWSKSKVLMRHAVAAIEWTWNGYDFHRICWRSCDLHSAPNNQINMMFDYLIIAFYCYYLRHLFQRPLRQMAPNRT